MIKKILDLIEKIIMFILGILMVVMVLVIFMQVILRYGFQSATNWADEVARYCMIWAIFLACPVGYRRKCHIKIDVLTRYLPEKAQKALELLMYILQLLFLGMLLYAAVQYISSIAGQRSIALRLNMQYIYLATVVGAVFMIIFILERIWVDILIPLVKSSRKEDAR